MRRQDFRLPDIGEGTAEAELVAWHVAVGDWVDEDQPLCDVMTDKATVEVTSPFSGRIEERHGDIGTAIAVGSVILVFEDKSGETTPADVATPLPSKSVPPETVPSSDKEDLVAPARVLAAPALRRRAKEQGIDLTMVRPSGPSGRVRQADLEAYVAYQEASAEQDGPGTSPAVSQPQPSKPPAPASRPFEVLPGEDDVVPIVGLRRKIAERLQDTNRRIPHFSYIEEVDVTQLEQFRNKLNQRYAASKSKLTLLPFLIQALVEILPGYANLNARYDDSENMLHRSGAIHVGIATQTPNGLVVTVLRDAQTRDLWGNAAEVARLADAARAGKATPSELNGSTITITSLGAMGGVATTPVINSPEVSILGVNKMLERPVVRDGRIEVAKMMNLSSSFDHRIVDGWDAALFIQDIKAMLESPGLLFTGV